MIIELGHLCLMMAACLALGQGIVKREVSLLRQMNVLQWILMTISILILVCSFCTDDFSLRYVYQHSNSHLPLMYKFCALWGGHEGSILLWIWLLGCWSMVAQRLLKHQDELLMRFLPLVGWLSFGLLSFLLFTSNPFIRMLPLSPSDGVDLNPLLQDPGLVSHPPMLYVGYVGFSVVAMLLLAIWEMKAFTPESLKPVRQLLLSAWGCLTLGITLGSWWAYRVLGWGGFWFWDPVENASLMPWLAGTALLHALLLTMSQHVFHRWLVILGLLTFSLSLLGTFLVRSGILISVHTFALDPSRGYFILALLGLSITTCTVLYWRSRRGLPMMRPTLDFLSKPTMLLINQAVLLVMLATVVLGTLYPLLLTVFGGSPISIGPPYFNHIFTFLLYVLIVFIVIAPYCRWEKTPARTVMLTLLPSFFIALLGMIVLSVLTPLHERILLFLILWLLISTVIEVCRSHRALIMSLAHLGFAIFLVGVVLSTQLGIEKQLKLQPNEMVHVGPYVFQFQGMSMVEGPNYHANQATVNASRGDEIIILHPEQRFYPVGQMALAHVAIDSHFFEDIYVALGEALVDGAWSFRIYYKPFVRWIWLGGLVMLLAALVGVLRRRTLLSLETVRRMETAHQERLSLIFFVLILSGSLSVFWIGLHKDPHARVSQLIGHSVPVFTLSDLQSGKPLTQRLFQGKVSVLNVWASWCPSCQSEHAFWVSKQNEQRLQLIGLNYRDDNASAKHWLALNQDPYKVVLSDPKGLLAMKMGITGTPETYLINAKGVVVRRIIGAITPDRWKDDILPEIKRLEGVS